jgi:hypothetical protein
MILIIVDTMNEKFVADIKIESFWEDENVIGKYNESTDWNPNLLIDNILSENRKTTKYKVEWIDERNTTKITQIQSIKGKIYLTFKLIIKIKFYIYFNRFFLGNSNINLFKYEL